MFCYLPEYKCQNINCWSIFSIFDLSNSCFFTCQILVHVIVPLNMSHAGWVEKSIWMWNRRRRYENTLWRREKFSSKNSATLFNFANSEFFFKGQQMHHCTEEDILKLLRFLLFQECCHFFFWRMLNNNWKYHHQHKKEGLK